MMSAPESSHSPSVDLQIHTHFFYIGLLMILDETKTFFMTDIKLNDWTHP